MSIGLDASIALLNKLAENNGEVGVFWDRGWGDRDETPDISIITDGNGQKPHARITSDAYDELLSREIVRANSYRGYKDRRYHAFKESL